MKVLLDGVLGCILACCGLWNQPLAAQDSELDLPETKMVVGLGEMTEDGQLKLSFGNGNAPKVPVVEIVKHTYTVTIPYAETEKKDGKEVEVTKYKTEERTRDVSVTRMVIQNEISVKVSGLKCFTITGQPVSELNARDHFSERKPVVVITTGGIVNEFFAQAFADDVMIVELPESVLSPPASALPAAVAPLPRRPAGRLLRQPSPRKAGAEKGADAGKKADKKQTDEKNDDK